MARELEKHLEKALGHEMVIFLRTEKELKEIAAATPFPAKDVEALEGQAPGRRCSTRSRRRP